MKRNPFTRHRYSLAHAILLTSLMIALLSVSFTLCHGGYAFAHGGEASASIPKNGSFLGYIRSTHTSHGTNTITVDQVEMLGAKDIAARPEVQAYIIEKEGYSNASEIDLPNDYYIYNECTAVKKLTLSKKVVFLDSLQRICTEEVRIDRYSRLAKHHKEDLFKITVKNGQVTKIDRIYLP